MMSISDIRPDPPDPGKGKLAVQHLHARIVGADHLGTQHFLLHQLIQRIEQFRALRHPAAHGLARDVDAMPLEHLLLAVQRLVVGPLRHHHLRQ
jgi:hypothetical protein